MGTVNSQLPKVSNIKALDVYFGMCFFYVFGALIEFSAVCYLDKGKQKAHAKRKEAEKAAKDSQVNRLKDIRASRPCFLKIKISNQKKCKCLNADLRLLGSFKCVGCFFVILCLS